MTKSHAFGLSVWSRIKRFAAHSGGAAATEFALIVPVLAGLVVAVDDFANISIGSGEMQTAARSAIQYAMHGGTDMTAAQALGMQAWNNKPSDAAMTVVQACMCGTVASACTAPCPDNSFPLKFVTVTASGTYGGSIYHTTNHLSEKVRLR
jgi:Flp pilus assembly protein TadG